jgi:hypothetical protein
VKYCEGYLKYNAFTPTEWVNNESPLFDNSGIIGVVCDDQEAAFNELTPLLGSVNPLIVTVDEENSLINHNLLDYDIPRFTDKMYDYIWREEIKKTKGFLFAPRNVPGKINFEYLNKQSRIQDFIAVVFIKISDDIDCLDPIASQISYDYTAADGNDSNIRHRLLRCQLSKYYIYNQEENLIYDFIEFQR